MANRVWLKISVETLLQSIAYKEANGFDFEADTLKSIISMTKYEQEMYQRFLESNIASRERRLAGYPQEPK